MTLKIARLVSSLLTGLLTFRVGLQRTYVSSVQRKKYRSIGTVDPDGRSGITASTTLLTDPKEGSNEPMVINHRDKGTIERWQRGWSKGEAKT